MWQVIILRIWYSYCISWWPSAGCSSVLLGIRFLRLLRCDQTEMCASLPVCVWLSPWPLSELTRPETPGFSVIPFHLSPHLCMLFEQDLLKHWHNLQNFTWCETFVEKDKNIENTQNVNCASNVYIHMSVWAFLAFVAILYIFNLSRCVMSSHHLSYHRYICMLIVYFQL